MPTPITWSSASSVSAGTSVDSDPIAIPNGTVGFSAIVSVLGGAPSGISGNLQVWVSNGGSYVPLAGSLGVNTSDGNTTSDSFSFENEFYTSAILRWVQAGPNASGTLFGGAWSITLAPPAPPPPLPPTPSSFQPQSSVIPRSLTQLTGYFNALFPNRWVAPGQSPVYSAIVYSIIRVLGIVGDQVLNNLGGEEVVPVLPAGTTVTIPSSLLQTQLRLRNAGAPLLDVAIHDFFGDSLPRLPNELDASYLARAQALLFQAKNTPAAIQNMLTALTGQPAHLINPNSPGAVGGYTATVDNVGSMVGGVMVFTHGLKGVDGTTPGPPCYWGYDQGEVPFRYANPNGRGTKFVNGIYAQQLNPGQNNFGFAWQGFIDTTWPENFGAQGNPVAGLVTVLGSDPPAYTSGTITGTLGAPSVYTNISGGNGFCACSNPQVVAGPDGLAQNVYATVTGGFPQTTPGIAWFNSRGLVESDQVNGQAVVLNAINSLRSEGVTIWARCLPAQFLYSEGFSG